MKIERINENQIKCTLNRSDLAVHHIRLSELAYGTEKTKDLFQDMMDQAFTEFGFEATESLMIEAIPVSMDCIILMITKIDEPEDMDQGFSGFSNIVDLIMQNNEPTDDNLDELDEIIDNLSDESFFENNSNSSASGKISLSSERRPLVRSHSVPMEKIFSFDDLGSVIGYAHHVSKGFKGSSSLFKSPDNGRYYLLLVNSTRSVNRFAHMCSLATEYGRSESGSGVRSSFLREHFEVIIENDALGKLSEI